jgi:hypothetical protein
VQPYPWSKQGGDGFLECAAANSWDARRRLKWERCGMGIECVQVLVLYGVDDVVQDFRDVERFPFLTSKPKWANLGTVGQDKLD